MGCTTHDAVQEARSKLYSVYLRPWTLERSHATAAVPYIGDLMCISANHLSDASTSRACDERFFFHFTSILFPLGCWRGSGFVFAFRMLGEGVEKRVGQTAKKTA